jgi:hypothetical protein
MSDILRFLPHGERTAQSFDVSDLIHEVCESLDTQCMRQGISIDVDAPPYTIVEGDRDRLWIVLDQLLAGVLKATPNGGTVVVIAYSGDEHGVEIEVAGSSNESFEQFKSRGLSSGTANEDRQAAERLPSEVRRIAASSGVEIGASKCPDGGTAFTIRIPPCTERESRKAA